MFLFSFILFLFSSFNLFLTKRFSIIHCCGVSLNKSVFLCGSFFLLWFFCFPLSLALSLPRCFPEFSFDSYLFLSVVSFFFFENFETKIYNTNFFNVFLTSFLLKKKNSNHPEYWPLCFSISVKRKLKSHINLGVIIQYYLQ